jgi:hypothetical protein
VQPGDHALAIGKRYCVTLEDLLAVNGWATGAEFPFPGETIRIPQSTVSDCLGATTPTTEAG